MSKDLVKAIGPCVEQNIIRVGYNAEEWSEDKVAVRKVASEHFGDDPQFRMVFASNPDLMGVGDESTRGVYLEKRDIQMAWVSPNHPELLGKTSKAFYKAKYKIVEELGLHPETIIEFMVSKDQPKFEPINTPVAEQAK